MNKILHSFKEINPPLEVVKESTTFLHEFEPYVLSTSDLTELKLKFVEFVKKPTLPLTKNVRGKFIINISRCESVIKVQKLYYNSLLAHQGLGTIK